jgi:hypothetical protein
MVIDGSRQEKHTIVLYLNLAGGERPEGQSTPLIGLGSGFRCRPSISLSPVTIMFAFAGLPKRISQAQFISVYCPSGESRKPSLFSGNGRIAVLYTALVGSGI